MARRCSFTSKAVLTGNKVSHSNRKSRKRFLPNLQNVSLISDVLATKVRIRISTNALRSVEVNGGLDNYLLSVNDSILSADALSIKRRIKKFLANKVAL